MRGEERTTKTQRTQRTQRFSLLCAFVVFFCNFLLPYLFLVLETLMTRDGEKFAMVFNEIYPALCRFLECLLGEHGTAQDIAQESFLRLYRNGLESIPPEEVRFWLFGVARNLAMNELSRRN